MAEYFSDPAGYLSRFADVSDKLGLAAGIFLRPFLGICFVMLWCRWLDHKRSHKTKGFSSIVTILAILAVCFSNATFNYNRGSARCSPCRHAHRDRERPKLGSAENW